MGGALIFTATAGLTLLGWWRAMGLEIEIQRKWDDRKSDECDKYLVMTICWPILGLLTYHYYTVFAQLMGLEGVILWP
jgi:hypothetical protein